MGRHKTEMKRNHRRKMRKAKAKVKSAKGAKKEQ
jgi:hypothetical protein